MLRCILSKLPGLAGISDVAGPPYQGQLIRSLSPVRSISPIRKEFCEAKKCVKIRKRSLSLPSYRPKTFSNEVDSLKLRFSDGKNQKDNRTSHARDLHSKPGNASNNVVDRVNHHSSNRTKQNHQEPSQAVGVSKNHKDEHEFYEISDQYELEAAKPRTSQSELAFNVFEYIEQLNKDNSVTDYLQPNMLKPFGSTDNSYYPSMMVAPQNFGNFGGNVNKRDAPKHQKLEKYAEDTQKRAYSSCSLPIIKDDAVNHDLDVNAENSHFDVPKSKSTHQMEDQYREDIYQTYDSWRDTSDELNQTCNTTPHSTNNAEKTFGQEIKVRKSKPMMPWPSYSETLRQLTNQKISDSADVPHKLTQDDNCDAKEDKNCPGTQSANKSVTKQETKMNSKRQSVIGNVQKRSISTKPPLSTAPKTKDAANRNKCFLPSKVRLKPPVCTPRPQYGCKKEEPCPPRADDIMMECVKPKRLPSLVDKPCPVIQPPIPDLNPKLKRLTFEFRDPPRVCPCVVCPCPQRADDSAPTKTKKLKKLVPSDCECVEPPPMIDVPLPRLKKVCEPEEKCYPPPVCPQPEVCERADENEVVCRKSLPVLKDSSCACVEPFVPDKFPSMKRLKFDFKDEERKIPCEPESVCPSRADDGMEIRPKRLPHMRPAECACSEPPPMVDVKLKRLEKFCPPEEVKKECPVETCEDRSRADDNLADKEKKLPVLEPTNCVCISAPVPDKVPPMRRLKMEFKDTPRECPCAIECGCPPRSDDAAPKRTKKLKPYVSGECLCVEPPPMVDVPVVRLTKRCVPDEKCYPKPECPPEEPCVRADEHLDPCRKVLPKLQLKPCPCIEEELKDAPKLKRLNLHGEDPPRIKKTECVCEVDCPRADDNWVVQPKPLPSIKVSDCPCVEAPMKDVKLKRLQCDDYPEECQSEDPCPDFPRADWGCWEYYTPTPKHEKCETKASKKKSITVNSRRKYNTDARLSCSESQKLSHMTDSPVSNRPKSRKFSIISSPTIELLKQLEGITSENSSSVVTHKTSKKYHKKLHNTSPVRNLSKNNLQSVNLRNLGTSSLNMAKNIEASEKPKKKIPPKEKSKMCNKHPLCPTFSSPNCQPRLSKTCKHVRAPVCCEKHPSPYPAFSELVHEEIEPYTKNIQWTSSNSCMQRVTKEEPSRHMNKTKGKRDYSTTSPVVGNAEDKIKTASQHPQSTDPPGVSRFSTFIRKGHVPNDKKLPDKPSKVKNCPKFKMDNCPAASTRPCKFVRAEVDCEKVPPPYKSFSDCLDEELAETLSECPIEVKKVEALQPRYMDPLDRPKLVEAVTPKVEKIDPTKEDECVRKKLCIEKHGLTQDCTTFGKHLKPMKAVDYLKEHKTKDCQKIEELKKAGRWPSRRHMSTLAVKCQKPGLCNGIFIRKLHSIDCSTHSRPSQDYNFHANCKSMMQRGADTLKTCHVLSELCLSHNFIYSSPKISSLYKIDAKSKSTYTGSTPESKIKSRKGPMRNKLLNLKPRYPMLPEMNMASAPSHLDRIDPLMDIEYTRRRFNLVKEGTTQDCSTFGRRLRKSDLLNQQICEPVLTAETRDDNLALCSKANDLECRKEEKNERKSFDLSKPKCDFSCNEELCIDAVSENIGCRRINSYSDINNDCPNDQREFSGNRSKIGENTPNKYLVSANKPYLKPSTKYKCLDAKNTCLKFASNAGHFPSNRDHKGGSSNSSKDLTLWQKIVNYFKARPNCPPPDEWKKKALKQKAEKAAKAAGLVLCDPKDVPQIAPKRGKLPKVITPVCPHTEENLFDDPAENKSKCCQTVKSKSCNGQRREYSTAPIIFMGHNRLFNTNVYSSNYNSFHRFSTRRFYSKDTCYKDIDEIDGCIGDEDDNKDAKIDEREAVNEGIGVICDNQTECPEYYSCPGWQTENIDELDEIFNEKFHMCQLQSCPEMIIKNSINRLGENRYTEPVLDMSEYFGKFFSYPDEELEKKRTMELVDELDKLINRIEKRKTQK